MTFREKITKAKAEQGVYFIAEIGQNHQGDINIAKQLVDSLIGTGVNAIKTAKRDLDSCLTEDQKKMPYVNPNSFGDTYYDHRKALELSDKDFIELIKYSKKAGFDFISSFTDKKSLDFLINNNVTALKIASQRLADIDLMNETSKSALPIIISTGMSNINHIDEILNIFSDNEKYILQCTSSYPCAEEDINLNVIKTYMNRYKSIVQGFGFSSHHVGIAPDIGAFMLGAEIIERHYTLSRSMKGTDHSASLEINGVKYVLKYIKQIKNSLGSYEKLILDSELASLNKLRADLKDKRGTND